MTPEEFRGIALSLPDTVECAHMRHPDFRVCGRIFATLGYPNLNWAVVNLTPGEQQRLSRAQPDVFVPVKGAWGRAGSTQVYLHRASKRSVRSALVSAWHKRSANAKVRARPGLVGRKPGSETAASE
jgi:hypothetical protein